MVAFFYPSEERIFRPRCEPAAPLGLPVLKVTLPRSYSSRRLERLAGRLYRKGLRRCLTDDPDLVRGPLVPISPLPLLRAKGAGFALALLPGTPLRQRRVALRGEAAGPGAWRLAGELCPRVGALLLDFDRGEESLARHLRERFGAPPLHLGHGPAPQVSVELAPRPGPVAYHTLRLWGEPELLGLTLWTEEPLPPELPRLPFLELLWETGRVDPAGIRVVRAAEWP